MILREYLDYVISSDSKNKEWTEWAEKKLDWYNPSINAEDSLMDEINRDTLEKIEKNKWSW